MWVDASGVRSRHTKSDAVCEIDFRLTALLAARCVSREHVLEHTRRGPHGLKPGWLAGVECRAQRIG